MPFDTAEDYFVKCAPALRTNIDRCGTVSVCNSVVPATADELELIYKTDAGKYKILDALLETQFDTKMCGAIQNSWEDFFLANMKTVKRGELQIHSNDRAMLKIKPFIMGKSRTPINNVYWRVSGGTASGANWQFDAVSSSGIPSDIRSFAVGERVYIESRTAGGAKNWWQGEVFATPTIVSGKVRIIATPQNAGSAFEAVENPVTGVLSRGSVNVAKTEAFCDNEPGYLDTRATPYWVEHTKYTYCKTDDFEEFRKLVAANNPLYREMYDLPEVDEIRQRTKAFWSKWFNNLMFGKPISGSQTMNDYTGLETVNYFLSESNLGFGGGRCSGFKANTIGWMEQLRQCDRVYDAGGDALDLWSLMDAIYKMMRVRMGIGSAAATQFDLFTDSMTAEKIDRAFILLFKDASADTMRLTTEIQTNKAFGFQYRSYRLRGKTNGVTLNVITHFGLDDYLSEWSDFGAEDSGRVIWLLDMTGMYAKIIETTNRTLRTGKLEDLAKVDASYQCVEETMEKETTQRGITYAAVVECPQADLIIYNFSEAVPAHVWTPGRPNYDALDNLYY